MTSAIPSGIGVTGTRRSDGRDGLRYALPMRMGWCIWVVAMSGCCFGGRSTSPECAAVIAASVRGDLAALGSASAELLRCQDAEGFEPIHHAAREGSVETVSWFLDHGVPIEVPGGRLRTPFYNAIVGSNLPVAQLLLDRGANIEARNVSGYTPWLMAAQNGDLAALQFLLERGADTRALTEAGNDSLLAFTGSEDFDNHDTAPIRFLLAHGAEVDLHGEEGLTALHRAARRRIPEWTLELLAQGANPNSVSVTGSTPVGIAVYHGFSDIETILRAHGGRSGDEAFVDDPPLLARSFNLGGVVVRSSGARPAPVGTRCTVHVRPTVEVIGGFNCTLEVDCEGGGHLYGGSGGGATFCDERDANLRAFDPWPTGRDTDPSAELDRNAHRFVVDDGLPGREGTRVTLLLDGDAPPAPAPLAPTADAPVVAPAAEPPAGVPAPAPEL